MRRNALPNILCTPRSARSVWILSLHVMTHAPQCGNDFLPNVPSLDIYDMPSGLELLLAAYKALLPEMRGCITQVWCDGGVCTAL